MTRIALVPIVCKKKKLIIIIKPLSFNILQESGAFEQFGVHVRLKGELWTLPLSGRVANAPAAMGSRWRFVLYNPLSLCGSAQVTARGRRMQGPCSCSCPGTRLRS